MLPTAAVRWASGAYAFGFLGVFTYANQMGFQEGVQAERERRADGVAGIAARAKAPVRALLGYVVPPAWTA
ncbi:hypothetical protein MNEG_14261, partial [Monoraphidium neglectum]